MAIQVEPFTLLTIILLKMIKINTLAIIVITILLFFFDKRASYYGNGVLNSYYDLNYDTSITKISDIYITDNSLEYGMGYISPKEYYTDSLFIDKLLGYNNTEKYLTIYILSKGEIKQLTFYNNRMIKDKSPMIKSIKKLPDNIINLTSQPPLYYYWKVIFMIGVLMNIILCGNILINIIFRYKKT